ncbi:hypothetical protein JOF46_001443 [Paeniglutamicibacter psychrophenolicus]|uniref:Uncharacterized protein n=1 Tax=Paeniglutamicibacter psychrophenolicus TaxID=257454 RepID=A0ABS4WBG1_9MICC|nr:hypothetical protein [Paeniglutamicibacter psychrophenolicus]
MATIVRWPEPVRAGQGKHPIAFPRSRFGILIADTSSCWSVYATRRERDVPVPNFLVRLWRGNAVLLQPLVNMAHNLVIVTLICHVVFIYVSGALWKAVGTPWPNGTVAYAPLQITRLVPWLELSNLATACPPAVAAVTTGSLLVQLFPGNIVLPSDTDPNLLRDAWFTCRQRAAYGIAMFFSWLGRRLLDICPSSHLATNRELVQEGNRRQASRGTCRFRRCWSSHGGIVTISRWLRQPGIRPVGGWASLTSG